MSDPFWDLWYFHIPNYLLAALFYTMIARFGMGLFIPHDWPNYIWRWFLRLTDPVLRATALLTPGFIQGAYLPLFALIWIALLRIALFLLMLSTGAIPSLRDLLVTG